MRHTETAFSSDHVMYQDPSRYSETRVCEDSQVNADEVPDSPRTLLGEEPDLDDTYLPYPPFSFPIEEKSFVPETPPWSPSTIPGNEFSTDDMSRHSLDSYDGRNSDLGDAPGSPTTVLGDEILDEPDDPSTTTDSDLADLDDRTEDESVDMTTLERHATALETPTRTRKYIQWPGFECKAVPPIHEWPAFILEAFANRDWKFELNSGDKAVLKIIAEREDLEAWFNEVGEEWYKLRGQQDGAKEDCDASEVGPER